MPFWAKDLNVGFANINAKAEGIENRPAFREAFQRRRCLVPVDGFYEWKKTAANARSVSRRAARSAVTTPEPLVVIGTESKARGEAP